MDAMCVARLSSLLMLLAPFSPFSSKLLMIVLLRHGGEAIEDNVAKRSRRGKTSKKSRKQNVTIGPLDLWRPRGRTRPSLPTPAFKSTFVISMTRVVLVWPQQGAKGPDTNIYTRTEYNLTYPP